MMNADKQSAARSGAINWGEPNSNRRCLLVGGLISELKSHLGLKVEGNRKYLESTADTSKLDGVTALVRAWTER